MTKWGAPIKYPELGGKKQCSKCNEVKDTSEFAPRGIAKGNSLFSHCRPCRSEWSRARKYFKKFGITWEQYQAMLEAQEYKCLACGRKADKGRGPWSSRPSLVLDHSHQTGKARGLLCNRCNWALGILEDRKLVKLLKKYLARFEEM